MCGVGWKCELTRKSATTTKSFSTRPREVRAGVPSRTPPGVKADVSPYTEFLFTVTAARSAAFSTLEPVS
jgi:hypothetical protein